MPWRTIDSKEVVPRGSVEIEVLLKGVFEKRRFLDLVLNFIVFDDDGATITKKVAAYHQFHAVNKAVECTLSACGIDADSDMLYAASRSMTSALPSKCAGRLWFGNQTFRQSPHRGNLAYPGKREKSIDGVFRW